MRHFTLLATTLLAASLSAQDFLHYKFDSTCTNEVVNYATGPSAWAANGALGQNSGAPYVPGVFGSALSGGNASLNIANYVDSGWSPLAQPLTGDLTLAFFAKERVAPGTALNYINGTTLSGHRLFTNGIAGRGLYQRNIVASGGNPSALDLSLPVAAADFQTLAAAGWVHIALVVDSTAATGTWYVNGTQVHQVNGVGPALINTGGTYQVGRQLTTNECNYDLDEWVLSNRAYSATEVLALSLAPKAGDSAYTSGIPSQCGAGNVLLRSIGGLPQPGNAGYAYEVTTTTTSLFLLIAGFDRCTFNGVVPLPLDGTPILPLLNGCWILADAPVAINGVAVVGAPGVVPLPIPGSVNLGTQIFTQALGIDVATGNSSMSSGFATAIGF
jgi:hypothetical protein